MSKGSSPRGAASVCAKGLASEKTRLLGSEKCHCVAHVLGRSPSTHGDGLEIGVQSFLGVVGMTFGRYPARRHRVHRNAERSQLRRHAATPTDLAALGRDVGAEVGHAAMEDLARHVHDAAPALLFHAGQGGTS